MQRNRMLVAGVTALVMGAGLVVGGSTVASAAPIGHWGTFTVAGAARAYTGTVTLPGFPATTYTSTSRQSTVISGASVWQGPATGPGSTYGSSRGTTYLNQRPATDTPNASGASVTTYTFATPTPGAGSWSFVLGDVDADQATIAATVPGGGAATAAQLGFQSTDNSCSAVSAGGWSCPPDPDGTTGRDVPTWNSATRTLTGNATATDTAGATAWFTPTVPLSTLTITYQQRSGLPVYQTWFADRTAAISGTATRDGSPVAGATVTATAPGGRTVTTTTRADGTYVFPELGVDSGYRVTLTAPDGVVGDPTVTDVSLASSPGGADRTGVDFVLASVTGTATLDGGPVATGTRVELLGTDGTEIAATTTDTTGAYRFTTTPGDYRVRVTAPEGTTGTATESVTIPAAGTTQDFAFTTPAAVVDLPGTVTDTTGAAVADVPVVATPVDPAVSDPVTATTGTDGSFVLPELQTDTEYSVVAGTGDDASDPQRVTTPAAGTTPTPLSFVVPAPVAVPTVVDVPGTVTDTAGEPVADVPVTATPTDASVGAPVTVTTAADGAFVLPDLLTETEYSVVAGTGDDASAPRLVTTPAPGTAATPLALVVAATPKPTPTPTPTPGTPSPAPSTQPGTGGGTGVTPGSGSGTGSTPTAGGLAFTGADLTPGLVAAGVLLLFGAGLLTRRGIRNRRRPEMHD